jgi:hypothetical protein
MLQAPLPLACAVQLHQPENANAADADASQDAIGDLRARQGATVGARVLRYGASKAVKQEVW